jgi:dinuclear metal center YbgI/SA1388 family protein
MQTVGSVIAYLDQFAPRELAAEWDNVGLLLGDRTSPVERIMTCLTVTPTTAAEAIAARAQLIVTHHPILFRAVKRLTADNPEGAMLLSLLRAGIAVHSPHTAFDNTTGGINDILANRLGLENRVPLRRGEGPRQCKVAVFVPDSDLSKVSDAMFAAGAGVIGQYSQCSYRLHGTGTFFGSDASNPTVGMKGQREEVAEWRLEVVCPEDRVEAVVAALRAAHSYEEPAFDVYPLKPTPAKMGEGRFGRLPRPTPLSDLARDLRQSLACGPVAFVGTPDRLVEKVAIVCGAGGELLGDAVRARADVLLTGELRYHDCLRAEQASLALVLPGHHATERLGVEDLAERLAKQWPDLHVWASQEERDPLRWAE